MVTDEIELTVFGEKWQINATTYNNSISGYASLIISYLNLPTSIYFLAPLGRKTII